MNENWQDPSGDEWSESTQWADDDTANQSMNSTAGPAPTATELQRVQSELWAALRREDDPDVRMSLLSRLSETRTALLALDAGPGTGTRPAATGGAPPVSSGVDGPSGSPGHDAWGDRERVGDPPSTFGAAAPRWRVGRHRLGADPGGTADHDPLGLVEADDDDLGLAAFGGLASGDGEGIGFVADLLASPRAAAGSIETGGIETGGLLDLDSVGDGYGSSEDTAAAVSRPADPYAAPRPRPMYQIGPSSDGPDALPDLPSVFAGVTASASAPPPPPAPSDAMLGDAGPPGRSVPGAASSWLRANLAPLAGPEAGQRVLVLMGALLSVIGIGWLVLSNPFDRSGETAATADDPSVATTAASVDAVVGQIQAAVNGLGLTTVTVSEQADGIHLGGAVASQDQIASALAVAKAIAGDTPVVSDLTVAAATTGETRPPDDATTARVTALQSEVNRVVAATPLIFETGKTDLTELHARILNNVASILKAYPDLPVRVIGYTDHVGSDDANNALSLARAANVKVYLVGQGVPEGGLITEARGSTTSTGSAELASLERRVEFEVVAVPAAAPAKGPLKVAIVAPSARNDLAFTQSMVDAINLVAGERGNTQVDVTDSTFVPAEAAAAIRNYADGDYDLIIAHGVEFGPELVEIVTAHPGTVFAWGTATDTFGLPNLYAYDAAAEQGGYVMGAMSAMLTAKGIVGEVGPIEVADAKRYINGFKAGAVAQKPDIQVQTTYTGSFGDIALAADAAAAHVAVGADVLTGTAEMVVGAVSVARDNHALWFGTQANQTSLAPDIVVASQVYHWEVLLRPIVADIDAGTPNGRALVATLADGGLVVEYNPAYPLAEPVKQRAEQLIADIKSGALVVPQP